MAALDMRSVKPAKKVDEDFYRSTAWRQLRAKVLASRGRMCEGCGKTREPEGIPVRLICDHIRERKDSGDELREDNLQLLCTECHNRKTAVERHKRHTRR